MGNFIGELLPFFIIGMVFGIPMVAIVTSHKRRMKEMELLQRGAGTSEQDVTAIKKELAELRDRVNDQALVIEGMRDLVRGMANEHLTQADSVQQRLNQ